jgi:hypothetical protein
MTLLVDSKMRRQAVFHTRFESQKDQVIPLVLLARMTLEIDRGDLPNRVTTSFTPVRTEADLTGPPGAHAGILTGRKREFATPVGVTAEFWLRGNRFRAPRRACGGAR